MYFIHFRTLLYCFLAVTLQTYAQDSLLNLLLAKDTAAIIRKVIQSPDKYKLQIIYTQIDRDQLSGIINTETFTYRNRSAEYFYPASMVKLPCAALALEKINSLNRKDITLNTAFKPTSNYKCWPNAKYLRYVKPQSLANLIPKLFAVSDNEAYNYIYELIGQKYIHERFSKMGFDSARIIQKFTSCTPTNNRTTGPVAFYKKQQLFYVQPKETFAKELQIPLSNTVLGTRYIGANKINNYGIDFKFSNYLSLNMLHTFLMAIIEPAALPINQRFKLRKSDYLFLKDAMRKYPRDLPQEKYHDNLKYPDGYAKYIGYGNGEIPLDSGVTIYNKVGEFYGYLTDCAYIENTDKKVSFFVSAVIYVNENDVINDGVYEYKQIGLPFLHRLGQILYNYELKRNNTSTR